MKGFNLNFLKSRRFYYTAAILLVLGANINALVEPVFATVEYVWSRQQSVVEQLGRWDIAQHDSPVNSVHAALLKTGKVLLIAGSGNNEKDFNAHSFRTVIWDPETEKFTEVPTPWDAFCSGHVFLPDGKLLVAGGTSRYEDLTKNPRQDYAGLKDSYLFNPDTERYEKVSDLNIARWYPTLTTLGDGKVLAAAGLDGNGKRIMGQTEIYDPATKQWTAQPKLVHTFPTYPSLILTGDGRLFYSGAHQGYQPNDASKRPGLWNLATNNFQEVSGLDTSLVHNAATVLLPPAQDQKVMILGGAQDGDSPVATDRTAIIDLTQPNPSFVNGPKLKNAIRYSAAVILPDDTVFQSGGSRHYRADDVLSASIYDPKTNTFKDAASPRVGRDYHAEAILLPDGRVATFGSNPIDNTFELRIEIYSPAYLFKGNRPTIKGGATEVQRGATATFTIDNPSDVATAKLMRPSAVTHVTDVEQRSINLPFTQTKDGIQVQVPANPNLVPSGWYMTFVTNKQGIPSKAHWVHVK